MCEARVRILKTIFQRSSSVLVLTASLALLVLCEPAAAQDEANVTCTQNYEREERFVCSPDEEVFNAAVQSWCREHGVKLSWDARYARVARLWSEHLLQADLPLERSLSIDRLRLELRDRGVTDAAMLPFSAVSPDKEVPAGLLQFLDDGVAPNRYTHFGLGVALSKDRQKVITTLLIGRRPARLDPLPVCPEPGSRVALRAQLREDYNYPRLLLGLPSGGVESDTLLYEAGVWRGTVKLRLRPGNLPVRAYRPGAERPRGCGAGSPLCRRCARCVAHRQAPSRAQPV